jgi:hypothetical protein
MSTFMHGYFFQSQPSGFALAWAAFQASVKNRNVSESGSHRIEQIASSIGE